jgi:GMP synthase (glutamine-hydrolysing)
MLSNAMANKKKGEHMKIYIIDNGGQWTHREWRTLRDLNIDAQIVPNTTPLNQIQDAAALVLSGGAPRIGYHHQLGNCSQYLEKASIPILGICAGHQFMAIYFGGECAPAATPEFGKVELCVEQENDLFQGIPKKSIAWVSHNDEVKKLPPDFINLASSLHCKTQAMKHESQPLYGLQFHPEVEHTTYGREIFKNFITVAQDYDG